MKYEYDVVVIGGGPGGYAAGIRASQLGAKVALLEPSEIGGTCVNRGCIPLKIWNRAAYYKETTNKSSEFGIHSKIESINFDTVVARQKGVSNDIQKGMQALCKNNKIEVFREKGVFIGHREIKAGEHTIQADKIIIATGTSLNIPDTPGLSQAALTTDQLFGITSLPSSILINGNGRIEIEIASLFSSFGTKVYLIYEDSRILTDEDASIVQRISKLLKSRGIEMMPKLKIATVEKSKDGFTASLTGGSQTSVSVDKILVSSRKPNTDMGLDSAGVKLDEKGFIQVDETLRTTNGNIFAIGDVTGGVQMSYAATCMGVIAAENALGQSKTYNSRMMPKGLWMNPEVASVGITEEMAEHLDLNINVGDFPISVNGVAMAYGQMEGSVKVISDAESGEILGVHIIGTHATEMIWGVSLAMQAEATVENLAYNYAIHPTFSETIAMAGQDNMGWALYLPRAK